MTVIKRGESAPLGHDHAVVLDLGDLRAQSERLVAEARAEADRILAESRKAAMVEAAELRADAERVGHADGEKAGREVGAAAGRAEVYAALEARLGAIADRTTAVLDAWESERALHLAEGRRDLVSLAVAIAERLVRRTLDVEPGLVAGQVEGLTELVSAGRDATIRVNPDDLELLRDVNPDLVNRLASAQHVHLSADASIAPGGAILTAGEGVVDARVAPQLDRIAEALVPGRPMDELWSSASTSTSTPEPDHEPERDESASSNEDDLDPGELGAAA